MQINGVGNGYDHSMHQVTECVHGHSVSKKGGGTASSLDSGTQQTPVSFNQQPDAHIVGYEAVPPATARQQTMENNPYFSAIEDTGREKQSIWEKVRVKFQSIAGQLLGRFSNKNSFQTKQEKPKEDLRKHSRYREDDLEIDCILTDDSYLMDSYDRKGEYSKLSTKK